MTCDHDSHYALQEAIDLLAILRNIDCSVTDPDQPPNLTDALTLASDLAAEIDAYLFELIADMCDHGYSWTKIRTCLTPAVAPQNIRHAHDR